MQTCLCNILRYLMAVKNDNFQVKNCDIFIIFTQNIDCGYTEAVLTHTHNLRFRANKKIMYTLCKPQFYYIQVGCLRYMDTFS